MAVAVSLKWRFREVFEKRFPWSLAQTVDPRQRPHARESKQRELFRKLQCCLGFTCWDLRQRMSPLDMVTGGRWTPFWQRALTSLYDIVDGHTASTEGLHAAHG